MCTYIMGSHSVYIKSLSYKSSKFLSLKSIGQDVFCKTYIGIPISAKEYLHMSCKISLQYSLVFVIIKNKYKNL